MGILQLLMKLFERLIPNFNSYEEKLRIIQNSIFGVDIQPMAIEISRLRAWLSVIIEEQNFSEIEPLPNLDFKFICANSLIELSSESKKLENDYVSPEFSNLREKYFNARNPKNKEDYKSKYKSLLNSIGLFDNEETGQFRSFDPFTNSSTATFFDPNFMFGVKDGFDLLIGNPPYIHFEKIKDVNERNKYKKLNFKTYNRNGDIYTLFYEKGIQLLKPNGVISFITSNKWLRAEYGKPLRRFLIDETNPKFLLDLGPGIFENAAVDTCVLITVKEQYCNNLVGVEIPAKEANKMKLYLENNGVYLENLDESQWVVVSQLEKHIKDKIEIKGIPLKSWKVSIRRGIVTGLNEAFVISASKRAELIQEDPKSADLIKPNLRGKDLGMNTLINSDKFLINVHNGYTNENNEKIPPIDINHYPAIKHHLDNYIDKLRERRDQGNTPYNLRNLAFVSDFSKPKIIWSDISTKPSFVYSEEEVYFTNSVYMIIGLPKEAVYILNSDVMFWYLTKISSSLGKGTRLFKQFVESLPLPTLNNSDLYKCLSKCSTQEEANKVLYQFYDLSNQEISEIKR